MNSLRWIRHSRAQPFDGYDPAHLCSSGMLSGIQTHGHSPPGSAFGLEAFEWAASLCRHVRKGYRSSRLRVLPRMTRDRSRWRGRLAGRANGAKMLLRSDERLPRDTVAWRLQ